jgi:hypothetical protein
LIIAGSSQQARAVPASNEGGGSGGYSQLPACGPGYWGQTLYVQSRFWRCVFGSDHWTL